MKRYKNRYKRKIKIQKRTLLKKKNKKKRIEKEKLKYLKTTLKYKISILPKEIQTKIYILTFKLFWRQYIPLSAKIPSWQTRYNNIQKTLWNAKLKNIHFLHLPFNTLPENKKWIMGCQCNFCLNDNQITQMEKHMHYLLQYRDSSYFPDKFMPQETVGIWNEKLSYPHNINNGFNYTSETLIKTFDPLCGSYKENKINKKLREGNKIYFNYL
tara:strand:- start:2832 stop:3470 length:639 start_codon:yes stop_codon:yes gene_type:complete